MALHNTQCPHCFTSYVISDEQYRVSEGMVRCGTCRERFQARFINSEISTPRFDPREAFIEPVSEDAEKIGNITENSEQKIVLIDPDDESATDIQLMSFTDHISESINSDLSLDIDDNAPITKVDSGRLTAKEMLANIRAKQAREKELKEHALQQELNLASEQLDESDTAPPVKLSEKTTPADVGASQILTDHSQPTHRATSEENLIDEVDSLVNDKLLNNNEHPSTEPNTAEPKITVQADNDINVTANSDINAEFTLNKQGRKFSWLALLLTPPLLIILAALVIIMVYQLWMKQIIAFDNNSMVQQEIVKATTRLAPELEKRDIVLPVRRNLSKLELLSARTVAHPTRSSTTLLKVDILNRANISQPLPWLEMTLTDSDGGLVSLRNLSPNDYIYNNNTVNQIGANELKKVTIELLSFPKQATGYELKLLNR